MWPRLPSHAPWVAEGVTLRGMAVTPGDRVRLVSPSSRPTEAWLAESVGVLESWGLAVEVGAHALDEWGYMAGRDEDRLADLNDAFGDPGVRASIATRGGAGAYRIADRIDFDAVRADPKPVVGFSDITNIHLALWANTGLATVHGSLAGPNARPGVRRLLAHPEPSAIATGLTRHARGRLTGGPIRRDPCRPFRPAHGFDPAGHERPRRPLPGHRRPPSWARGAIPRRQPASDLRLRTRAR
jgi:hypothetical protein